MPARRRAGILAFGNVCAGRRPLGLPDELVGEVREPVTDGPGVQEAHGLLVAGLPEEPLAGPEQISAITWFADSSVFPQFGLPRMLR
jgi:hypothetical protein